MIEISFCDVLVKIVMFSNQQLFEELMGVDLIWKPNPPFKANIYSNRGKYPNTRLLHCLRILSASL